MVFRKKGIDVRIDNNAKISRPELLELGNHIAIDAGSYFSCGGKIGDYVHIAANTNIIGGALGILVMNDFSGISAGSTIVCAGDDFTSGMMNPQVPHKYRNIINKPVIFERFACVGVNSVVMPGVTLAEGSVLGANSLLTKDTEPWTIYVGSPAKPVGTRDKEVILFGAKKLGYE